MAKVTYFINQLLNLGTKNVKPELKIFVGFTNINGISYFILDLILALIFYFIAKDIYISIGLVCAAFAFLLCSLGFNYLGWTTVSRLSTGFIGSLLVVFCALYLGPQSFAAGSLLLGAVFPFVYFSISEKKWIVLSITFPLLAYLFLVATSYDLGPKVGTISRASLVILQLIFFLVPLVGIFGNCYKAVSENAKKSKTLAESRNVIETIFYAVSHDLATPIQSISVLADLGRDAGTLTAENLKKMHVSTDQIVRIFRNLQTIAKYSTDGKLSLQMEKSSLKDLIIEALAYLNDQALSKNIQLEFENDCSLTKSVHVFVDRDVFIFQILTNFITNSLKFSEKGQKIRINFKLTDADNVQIIIRDWGCGIHPKLINNLFCWSERATTKGTLGESGSGFGLLLAAKFLQAMSGKVQVISEQAPGVGRGTTVLITIPTFESIKNYA